MVAQCVRVRESGPDIAETAREVDQAYQIVQLDSAAATAGTRGAVTWWKDKAKYIVSTDPQSTNRNLVAGIIKGHR